jgi:mono/diheme cytochrome c family protein
MKRTVVLVAGAALLCATAARGADTNTLRAIGQGKAIYLTHCAPCHGADSSGTSLGTNGLDTAGPDLTILEKRDGRLDPVHVAVHIEGQPSGACTAAMPCWQQRFNRMNNGDRALTFLQIYKLAKYVEFVQGGMPTVPVQAARR